jgi:hypothetical protein
MGYLSGVFVGLVGRVIARLIDKLTARIAYFRNIAQNTQKKEYGRCLKEAC